MTLDSGIDRALDALGEGRVVAAATESSFGLFADVTRSDALDRLFSIKPREQGVALVLPDRASWSTLVTSIPPIAERLADRFWPGGLTIALPAAPHVDRRVTVDGTVGVRLPGPSAAATIAPAFGRPLTATSANRHGQPPAMSAADVEHAFPVEVTREAVYVVAGRAPGGPPSTIVVVRQDSWVVVRPGAISEAAIRAAAEQAL